MEKSNGEEIKRDRHSVREKEPEKKSKNGIKTRKKKKSVENC